MAYDKDMPASRYRRVRDLGVLTATPMLTTAVSPSQEVHDLGFLSASLLLTTTWPCPALRQECVISHSSLPDPC
ncbi:hypothetical protein PAXRUDRAFT_834474 [Paxillus rubicundulus Ve08.2h10]|uniref:Uncharacterized protein n=1 Tax=Paxillus rubicundulus Ve08.2h10 TaxID=930991 RepID=A0A0D0DDE2_9AGAM|nr:hypothetical protein PAXRUDRAFT_834474 [Paxillus rubicundulus Ve08.2h10]